ncbi:MAG: hypothetical protein D8H95_09075 [Lachnospiraceae bacterium]|nr:MAG: hypothetical protein D8H95_09075 [Lachnospiraceae bacterium]
MKYRAKRHILYLGHMYTPGEFVLTSDVEYLEKLVANDSAECVDDEGNVISQAAVSTEDKEPVEEQSEELPFGEEDSPDEVKEGVSNKPIGRGGRAK